MLFVSVKLLPSTTVTCMRTCCGDIFAAAYRAIVSHPHGFSVLPCGDRQKKKLWFCLDSMRIRACLRQIGMLSTRAISQWGLIQHEWRCNLLIVLPSS
jgi:hypothetical protein